MICEHIEIQHLVAVVQLLHVYVLGYHGHKPPGLLVTNLGTEHGEIHKNNRDTVQQAGRLDVADVQL